MNFLSPTSLLLFGLAIPIVALYILRLRRRREPISTLMFWEELFRERQTTSLFQRLKHLLSLLLQLLFLTLLVLSIARPQFAFITKSARQLVLIIDQSASMNAIEAETDERTRLEVAKESALRSVDGLRFMDEMTIISSHTRPIIHIPFTNHQKSLREAIHAIQPTDISTNLEPAYDLAYAIAQTKPNPEVVIFSDFQSVSETLLAKLKSKPEQDTDTEAPAPEVKQHLIQIGKANDNVGITKFRVRKSLVNAFDYQTLLRVVNASEEEKKFNVELYFDENLFDVRPYTLAPGESKSEIFSNFAFEGGKLKAVLDIQDPLVSDNIAYATLPKRDLIPVLLVTADNPFLQKALAVDEQLQLTVLTPTEYETDVLPESANSQGKKNYQVVIFDRYSPPTLGDGNYMFIYPPAVDSSETPNPELKWNIGAALETPIITDWERTHPILQHVHLENVQIGTAYEVTPPSTAQVLARSFESPVLFIDVKPNRKIVFAAINILESDLPLRIAFPVIIANTIQWFQQRSEILEYHLHTGEVLKQQIESIDAISQPELKTETDSPESPPKLVKITGPGDQTWELPVEGDELLFEQTQRAGFYELKISEAVDSTSEEEQPPSEVSDPTKDNSGTVWAVNLADATESHIGADPAVEDLTKASVAQSSAALLRYPPWVYLVFLAVGLSVFEWFLYQRRRID
ncbi:VWA domain-containing protein [Candidatus Poribacteria bacterium]|nr:VWA domain-containing protein [Candidatus Poribacteria bacterium]MYG08320.1 VWA domain-containing protein [Candidatus Poribacteria bacterium]MYK20838.1 VWA domain-containing protein [Candidatus Poribacteria bacterium]